MWVCTLPVAAGCQYRCMHQGSTRPMLVLCSSSLPRLLPSVYTCRTCR